MWQTKLEVRRVVRSPVMVFRKDELVIGCDEFSDINLVITDAYHANLRVDPDGSVWIVDRGMPLGTQVNGVRIEKPTKLALDDIVSFAADEMDIGTSSLQLAAAPVRVALGNLTNLASEIWQIELSTRYAYPAAEHVVRGAEIVIGSAPPSQLVLAGDDVASQHCALRITDDCVFVTDLGSELGTTINGVPIDRPTALEPGADLEIAAFSIKLAGVPERFDEPAMQTAFEVHARGAPLSTITFRKSVISIGRAKENDIPLPTSRQASKRHCTLRITDGVLTVEDNDSANGTWINGHRITDVMPLTPNDRLYVGEFAIVCIEPPHPPGEPIPVSDHAPHVGCTHPEHQKR